MPIASSQPIDWGMLGRAAAYYAGLGFTYIEVPWIIRNDITEITRPEGAKNFSAPHGDLVGSAEQSFIQMMVDGVLPPGRYYTVSPCFRDEPVLDDLHEMHFMKLELIDTRIVPGSAAALRVAATGFLVRELDRVGLPPRKRFAVEYPTDEGDPRNTQQDLMARDEDWELGSYGVRHHGDLTWVYGTGCAEPRWGHWIKTRTWKEKP